MQVKGELTREEIIKTVHQIGQRVCEKCDFLYNSKECVYANECSGAECVGYKLRKLGEE